MTRACVQRARTAVIDGRDDNETLAIAVAIDHANPDIHLVAALRDLGRRENLRYVNPGVQAVQWHMPFLLSEEANDPGITQIYNDLMSSGGHGNTYSMRVPAGFAHATFGDCQTWFGRTHGATVLAVRDSDGLVVSPPWDRPVPAGDDAVLRGRRADRREAADRRPLSSEQPEERAPGPPAAPTIRSATRTTVVSTGTTTQRRLNLRRRCGGAAVRCAGGRRARHGRAATGAPPSSPAAGRPGGHGRRGRPSRGRPSRPRPASSGPRRRSGRQTPPGTGRGARGGGAGVAAGGGAGGAGGGRAGAECRALSCRAACEAVLRWAGSLVSRPRRTGSSGPARSIGAGCSDTTDSSVAIGSPLSNGGRPSTAAYSVAPSDHRSTGGRGSSPLARSGRHVGRRADEGALRRQAGVAGGRGDAEVGEAGVPVPVDEHVARLDVAVDDPGVVGRVERGQQVQADRGHRGRGQRALVLQDLLQAPRGDVLHHQPGLAVLLDDVVDPSSRRGGRAGRRRGPRASSVPGGSRAPRR